ncbi:hypothetical protein [Fodinicurvata fenggangensis]|uniref:hypothetical protein n=1 Tax=Fodinicurvata fenggangensis TaxID=1121830 RepID=UPI00047A3079|nr:hypothetical protein [Fodinicurvata fenggangensis]
MPESHSQTSFLTRRKALAGLGLLALTGGLAGCGSGRDLPSRRYARSRSGSGNISLALLTDSSSMRRVGENIDWRIYHHEGAGGNHSYLVKQRRGANPRMSLPSGWYYVEAHHSRGVSTHTIEVMQNNSLDYYIVRD